MRWLAAVSFWLLCAAPAAADRLTIVTEEFPPYNFTDSDGKLAGVSTDVVQAVLAEIGEEDAPIEVLPWARAYNRALHQRNTLIFSIGRIPEREDLFEWIGVIAPYRTSFYVRADDPMIEIDTLEDAKQHLVGVSIADVILTYLEGQGFRRLEVVGQDYLNLRKLLQGRLDVVAFDEASFGEVIRTEGLDPDRFRRAFRIDGLSGHLYMALQRNSDPALVKRFREGLEAIKRNGTYDRILGSYRLLD